MRTTPSRPTTGGSKPGCGRCTDLSACARRGPSQPGMRSWGTCAAGITRSPSTLLCMIASVSRSRNLLYPSDRSELLASSELPRCVCSNATDIPGFSMSSCCRVVVGPGGGLVVEGAGLQAAVQDADEPVGELA